MSNIKLSPKDVLEGIDNRTHTSKRRKTSYWERVNLVKSSNLYREHGSESKYQRLSNEIGYSKHDLAVKNKKAVTKTWNTKHGSSQSVHFGDIIAQTKKAS